MVRSRIPKRVAVAMRFAADDTCCKCRRPGSRTQVHHLDGDPTNHDESNLIVLCLECHDAASVRGGVGRQLDSDLLRSYRVDWLETVTSRRRAEKANPQAALVLELRAPHHTADAQLDLMAAFEIRKTGYAVQDAGDDWDCVESTLRGLPRIARDFRHAARTEVIRVAYDVSGDTRLGLPGGVARILRGMVSECLPLLLTPEQQAAGISALDRPLLRSALSVGRNLVYDATKYLRSLEVSMAGSSILKEVLRTGASAEDPDLVDAAEGVFDEMIVLANTYEQEDIERWLRFERAEAREAGSGDYESVRDLLRPPG
jgi:hypothetical protein